MQTQCPHCKTQFRLNKDQLHIAEGLVRCGVCDEVFNALKEDASNNTTDKALTKNSTDSAFEAASDTHAENGQKEITADENRTISEHEVNADKAETEFDLFQLEESDDSNFSANSVIPDKYRNNQRHSPTVIGSLLWSLAILFLGFTLIVEYVWFNRNQLAQLPEAQPWIKQVCKHVNCAWANLRNPAQIELLRRNIYNQPNRKQALTIAVTLVNHASYAQPYPDMQVDFSNIRGRIVAARRFTPKEYLPTSQNLHQLLTPGQPVSFTLAIKDPGKQAMTYEFSFL